MQKIRRFILLSRVLGILLFIINYLLFIYIHIGVTHVYITCILIVLLLSSLVFLFLTFCINIKEYKWNDNTLIVYAGYENYYLFLNNERVTTVTNQFFTGKVRLEYLLINDNLKVEEISVDIQFINRISLYVDGKLLTPVNRNAH